MVKWPSGMDTVIDNPAIDQYHNVLEVPCLVDVTATASADAFCHGESVTLSAPLGFASYEWSNGGAEATTEVTAGGAYSVLVYDEAGCAGFSNLLTIIEVAGNAPAIAFDGSTDLCDGSVLTLTASDADNYTWSTGDETQSIDVTTSGSYAVYSVDICGNAGTSDTLVVEVFDAPLENPTVTPDQTIMTKEIQKLVTHKGAVSHRRGAIQLLVTQRVRSAQISVICSCRALLRSVDGPTATAEVALQ